MIGHWNRKLHFRLIAAIQVVLVLLLLLASCGPRNSQDSPHQSDNEDWPVLTIMAPLHFPHPPHADVISEIERLTQSKLEIEWVPNEVYTDKMNSSLTTNSLKKATFVKYTDYILLKYAIRSGAFWEIGPYLKDYPNLRYLDSSILQQAAVEGKIYGLYTERQSSRQGAIIRKDWLDHLGLDVPSTIDELYEVLWQFTYNDPDNNGMDDTFGLVDRNDLVFGAFKTISSYFGTPNNWAVEQNKLIPEFETPEYMDTMNFMRKLYLEKLINQDFAITSKQVQRDFFIRGTAGVYIGSMTDSQRLYDEAKKINPKVEYVLVNRIAGPKGYRVWSIPNYNGLYLFSKKAIKTEDELREILAFFDRTMDKDVSNLMRYGFEGRHHTVTDGIVTLPDSSSALRVQEVNALHALMIADLSNPNLMEVEEREHLMALAEDLSEDNENFLVKDPTVSLESPTYDEKGVELQKIISDATYNYIIGNLDEAGFYNEVERWKRTGGSQIIEEFNKAYLDK